MLKKFLVVIIIFFFLSPGLALADGMVIKPDPYRDRWDYVSESNQQAYINYEGGLEKLILSIGLEEASENAVWIFPVPANPEKVVIDILTEFPDLKGEEINKKAKSQLENIKYCLLLTQIYTPPFILKSLQSTKGGYGNDGFSLSGSRGYGYKPDVVVHEHLEKEGITTEVITAKTSEGLYGYFKSKRLNIEKGSIPVLDHYIGKEFTFVASWLSMNIKVKSKSKQKGVFVTFPTTKLYYPLLPTSVYGSEKIPTTIRIMGFVSPKIFKDIKNYTKTEYYVDDYINSKVKNFYNGSEKNVKYTKIEINAPSKLLTQDLWMSKGQPVKILIPLFIGQYPVITGIILLILISILTGILAGIIIFREARSKKGILKFGWLGFFNCFTIIALTIRLAFYRIKKVKEENKELARELKEQGYSVYNNDRKRKIIFVPLYSVTYIILVVIIFKLIAWSL